MSPMLRTCGLHPLNNRLYYSLLRPTARAAILSILRRMDSDGQWLCDVLLSLCALFLAYDCVPQTCQQAWGQVLSGKLGSADQKVRSQCGLGGLQEGRNREGVNIFLGLPDVPECSRMLPNAPERSQVPSAETRNPGMHTQHGLQLRHQSRHNKSSNRSTNSTAGHASTKAHFQAQASGLLQPGGEHRVPGSGLGFGLRMSYSLRIGGLEHDWGLRVTKRN